MATIEEMLAQYPELGGLWNPETATYTPKVMKLAPEVRAAWSPTHLLFEIQGEAGAIKVDSPPFH
jgi:hypothetical protein